MCVAKNLATEYCNAFLEKGMTHFSRILYTHKTTTEFYNGTCTLSERSTAQEYIQHCIQLPTHLYRVRQKTNATKFVLQFLSDSWECQCQGPVRRIV